ncbi:NAD(P)/FAD-dependent oxidoreductase [Paludibacterium purpuratum]|uniref:Gamma-glutamylputrescine oxidase n=1 Tax=Paludibacterium purpuratum TaxID=1144873 RepID=A0A4R7B1H6_9NEIS|nr:FAD-dependent oxidoreductase [Paludibacterium purpuratum]TDR73498.1 gamma-glutamylputrescine oxidase [Paludibacterium purpuratum]
MRHTAPHLDTFQGRHADSWYADSLDDLPVFPALEQQVLETDVCIVGAGLTGLTTALTLAENGIRAVVLEGALVGFGASGRNGGQVLHGFACPQTRLARQLGDDGARLCWALSLAGVAALKERVERHNIDCDLHWGYVTVAENARQLRALADWRQALHGQGYPRTTLLTGADLREEIDSPAYIGGLHDSGCGHLHPLRYTLGLARAAVAQGAQLFERTRVSRIDEDTRGVIVHTAGGGTIRADRLILACNVDIGALKPGLARRFLPVASHIVATAPLPAELRSRLLPREAAVCDSRHVLNYFRLSSDGRLLFGGRLKRPQADQAGIRAERRAEMARIFPELGEVAIDYSWGGYIDMGLNKVPQFGRLGQRILYAQGFAGHGVALTGIAGQLMARAIEEDNAGFDLLAGLRAPTIPFAGRADDALIRLGVTFYRLRDRLGL